MLGVVVFPFDGGGLAGVREDPMLVIIRSDVVDKMRTCFLRTCCAKIEKDELRLCCHR